MQNRLSRKQLEGLFKTFAQVKDKKGRSLLQRAREYLLEHPKADKYATAITYTLEDGKLFVDWDCTCKDADKHREGTACKHTVALLLLDHRDILETSSNWREWFKEYDQALRKAEETEEERIRKAIEDFGNF